MSVPAGWLADPLGAGSPNVQAALPVPADGFYAEPGGAVGSFETLPVVTPSAGLVNGGGSIAARTDEDRLVVARLRRTTVFGVVLLDRLTVPRLGGLRDGDGVRPVTPATPGDPARPTTPLAPELVRPVSTPGACGVRPASTLGACGVRP